MVELSKEAADLESSFLATASALFAADSVDDTLLRIVELAERAIEGCTAVSIFFADNTRSIATAINQSLMETLNRLEFQLGQGPSLEAASLGTPCSVDDLLEDDRWPLFSLSARQLGLRSILTYPLSNGGQTALSLYSTLPRAFSPVDRAQGQLLSTLGRLALDSAYQRADGNLRAENLTEALRTRELIGQAQGILMERERLTADQAFDVLRKASQRMNVKLRSVAEDLVRTGEHPSTVLDSQPDSVALGPIDSADGGEKNFPVSTHRNPAS